MELDELTALSPIDGRYAKATAPLRPYFSEYALIRYRVHVETQWLIYLCQHPDINTPSVAVDDLQKLREYDENFDLTQAQSIKSQEKITNHDVKAVEYELRKLCEQDPKLKPLIPWIHFACTSEDINNVAYALMLNAAREDVLIPAMQSVIDKMTSIASDHADLAMLSRTHGQAASPTTLGKEIANSCYRLHHQLKHFKDAAIAAKFNGAVGNHSAHRIAFANVNWPELNRSFIEGLGLAYQPYTTQIEPHDDLAMLLHAAKRFNTALIDFNRDVWGYISLGYFNQRLLENEVGSSTMPHKVNPIDFENAEGNLGVANALAGHLADKLPISRWQRDLSDSTVLRNLGSVFAYAFIAYQSTRKGLDKIQANPELIQQDLQSRWELLAEPMQTILRREGVADAYEQLKQLSRGKTMNQNSIQSWIDDLDVNASTKAELHALKPDTYLGYAPELTQSLLNEIEKGSC